MNKITFVASSSWNYPNIWSFTHVSIKKMCIMDKKNKIAPISSQCTVPKEPEIYAFLYH